MMKLPTSVKVVKNKCIGCGKCYQIAPEIFDFDDNGLAQVLLDDNTGTHLLSEKLIKNAKLSARACPTAAIIIDEK